MQSMMGGGAPQEDMFAKLESMRAVINEVNQQFTDPVRPSLYSVYLRLDLIC
jgi:arsenite-transporting ATPase